MLRRSVAVFLEASEMSNAFFMEYLSSALMMQDVVASLCSLDQAMFTLGYKKPMRLLFVAQHALAVRVSQRFCQSLAAGVLCCGPRICRDSVTFYMTNAHWQELVFDRFYASRLLRWVGAAITPLRLQRMAQLVTGGATSTDGSGGGHQAAEGYAAWFREDQANKRGIAQSVIASNLVVDLAALLSDQLQWMHIYYSEVYKKWRSGSSNEDGSVRGISFGTLLRRTLKTHVASTVMSFAEIALHWTVRMLGKAASQKLFRGKGQHINSVPAFWVEHILLAVSAPLLARVAHLTAVVSFKAMEKLFPATSEEATVDEEDADHIRDEEAEQREHYFASKNSNDLYAALGVEHGASDAEIKKAYRQRALQYHPDRVRHLPVPEQEAAQQAMSTINEAYEVLSCDTKRAVYDASRPTVPFDEEHPPAALVRFMRLPIVVQGVCGVSAIVVMVWLGGTVLYAHTRTHFMTLTEAGRGPVRYMCRSS